MGLGLGLCSIPRMSHKVLELMFCKIDPTGDLCNKYRSICMRRNVDVSNASCTDTPHTAHVAKEYVTKD